RRRKSLPLDEPGVDLDELELPVARIAFELDIGGPIALRRLKKRHGLVGEPRHRKRLADANRSDLGRNLLQLATRDNAEGLPPKRQAGADEIKIVIRTRNPLLDDRRERLRSVEDLLELGHGVAANSLDPEGLDESRRIRRLDDHREFEIGRGPVDGSRSPNAGSRGRGRLKTLVTKALQLLAVCEGEQELIPQRLVVAGDRIEMRIRDGEDRRALGQ